MKEHVLIKLLLFLFLKSIVQDVIIIKLLIKCYANDILKIYNQSLYEIQSSHC